ncbi:MAG: GYD domain-containing protein [Alphaproteobacteria bacterium]|nr:GYD domain-containing protein [Alphaproteobacteria bacterium]
MMRYVLIGKHNAHGMDRPIERRDLARAMLEKLGVKRVFGTYVFGEWDFVDVVEAATPSAVLAFSVWYRLQGFGTVVTMPAIDYDDMQKATDAVTGAAGGIKAKT